jgi:4-amino-4-deoxy-L-arabinose transferase-like glycosyltransferase
MGVISDFNRKCSLASEKANACFQKNLGFLFREKEVKTEFILLFIFLLSFLLGFALINDGLFHYDAVRLAQAVEKAYETGALQRQVQYRYGSVVLNSVVYLPFYLIGSNADFSTRVASVIFHSLSVVFLFLFIKSLSNKKIALFTSLMFLFTPLYFSSNTYGKEHGAALFILFLSFYLLELGARKESKWLLAFSSIVFVFSMSVRESMIIFTPFYFLLYLKPKLSSRHFSFNVMNWIYVMAPFTLLFILLLMFGGLYEVVFQSFFVKSTATVSFLGLFSPVLALAFNDLVSVVPVILLLFSLAGVVFSCIDSYKHKNYFVLVFMVLWFLLIFYFGNTSGYKPRYIDSIFVPVFFFTAVCLLKLYAKNKLAAVGVLLYFIISMFFFMYPFLNFRHSYNGEKEFALFVKNITEKDALIITMDDAPFIQYYGNRTTLVYAVGRADLVDEWILNIRAKMSEGRPVYVMESAFSYDGNGMIANALQDNFNITLAGQKLSEDYHNADIKLATYEQRLFKLS